LRDPARVFPVTVDPTYASASVAPSFDAYVQSNVVNTDYSPATELRVGTYDWGTTKARSFINFPTSAIRGKQIQSASLSLYEFHSYSCTAAVVYAQSTSALASSATRWASQPGVSGASSSASFAKGYSSSCPGGRVSIPVTAQVQAWSTGTATTQGLRLWASETFSSGWKMFYSIESSQDPVLSFTYNRAPATPAKPTVDNSAVWNSVPYAWKQQPVFRVSGTDPDASAVSFEVQVHSSTAGDAGSLVTSCTTPRVASGSATTCTAGKVLANNTRYWIRAKATDERGLAGGWTSLSEFRTAQAKPPTPVISCPGYPNGSWADAVPAGPVKCTASTTAAASYSGAVTLYINVDGALSTHALTSQGPYSKEFTVPAKAGGHTVTAYAQNAATVMGDKATITFGYGGASLSWPVDGDVASGPVKVAAVGPPLGQATAVSGQLRWRRAGSGSETEGWTAGPAVAVSVGSGQVSASTTWDPGSVLSDLEKRSPARLDVQLCFIYTISGAATNQCTWSQSPVRLLRLPHAFGGGFPVADAGPGQVALWTGEFNTSVTDVTVPGYTGTLSLSRSHSSYAGPDDLTRWPAQAASGVLGPGWTAQLDGSDVGDAGLVVYDNSHLDGTIAFVDEDGSALVFATPSGKRRTAAGLPTGTWSPVDAETAESGVVLTVADVASVSAQGVAEAVPGGGADLLLRDVDGTITTFVAHRAPNVGGAGEFTPALVDEPGALGATVYSRDAAGRITRILAPTPPGVTCAAQGTLAPGCRALLLTYGTQTGNGEVTGQLKTVALHSYDPQASPPGMVTRTVATYSYDSANRLAAVSDPRSGLTTRYAYVGTTPRLASITPAGQAAYKLSDPQNGAGAAQRLQAVHRPPAAGSGADVRIASYVYDIDPATMGTAKGLPALAGADVGLWQQRKPPTYGAAAFGPDRPAASTTTLAAAVVAADWPRAELQYTDEHGYTTNTASHGAGAWQLTAADYDEHGNVVRALDARAIALLTGLAEQAAGQGIPPGGLSADHLATITQYNAEQRLTAPLTLADGTVLPAGHITHPVGAQVAHEWGPARWAADPDGQLAWVRPHTATSYDEGAPGGGINLATGQPYHLPTTVTVGAADPTTATWQPGAGAPTDLQVHATTVNGYDALEAGAARDGDTSGWVHGSPTAVTQVLDPTAGPDPQRDITRVSVYDGEGRLIQTRQPSESGTGSRDHVLPAAGAGTTLTRYYTAAAQSAPAGDPACGNQAHYAGLVCTVGPAGQPAGQPIPTRRVTGYSYLLAEHTVVETSGGVERTTTTSYLPDGRLQSTATTATGLPAAVSKPVATTVTGYDPATGLATSTTATYPDGTTATISTGYDSWGRPTNYTDADGRVTTTSYDSAGRVATVTDPGGQTTYGYGPGVKDSRGQTEYRSLPTRITTTVAGAVVAEVTGAYDGTGQLVEQRLPGGITQNWDYDIAGEPVGLTYTGPIVDPDSGQASAATWLAWSQDNDALGRVVTEYTPDGTVFDDHPEAAGYHRRYSYDGAGRLVTVKDRTADPATGALTSDQDAKANAGCLVREYGFGKNGTRTRLDTRAAEAGAECPSTGGSTRRWTYDTADRITAAPDGSPYVYDQLGRVTTLPAADTLNPAAGPVALGYYLDDAAWTISQGGLTQTHDYDPVGRRALATSTDTATGAWTRKLLRIYTDTSDNPSTTIETLPAAGIEPQRTITTRYVTGLAGDLTATHVTEDAATQVMIADPHGDITATITLPQDDSPAAGIDSWHDTDEYGNPRNLGAASGSTPAGGVTSAGYGWHGAKQRSADTPAGLTLMGARLYNPVTGHFTSTDPVAGGNDTTYTYPVDPVGKSDLDGRRASWKRKLGRLGIRYHLWHARQTSRVVGGAAWAAAKADGATCRNVSGLRTCYGARGWSYARGGTTFGDTYVTGPNRRARASDRIRHEKVHRAQWRTYGWAFPVLYGRAGRNACRNKYEKQAGLRGGGYRC
jgi:RHS repeat-associated protein